MLRRTLLAAPLLLAVFLLCTCGGGGAGYGVVLWGESSGSPQTEVAGNAGLVRETAVTPVSTNSSWRGVRSAGHSGMPTTRRRFLRHVAAVASAPAVLSAELPALQKLQNEWRAQMANRPRE